MKRKIFSITLAILLILSSLGGLTAFAETTTVTDLSSDAATTISANDYSASGGTLSWQDTYLNMSKNAYATYTVNVPAGGGNYGITLNMNQPASYRGYFQVFIDGSTTREPQLYRGVLDTVDKARLGIISLAEGQHTIKLLLADGNGAHLESFTLDPTTVVTAVPFETATTINAYSYATQSGAVSQTNSGLEIQQSDVVTYEVNISKDGDYFFTVDVSSGSDLNTKAAVFVNGVQQPTLHNSVISSDELEKIARVSLTAGQHTIRIKCTQGTLWMKSFTIEGDKRETALSYTTPTTISADYYSAESGTVLDGKVLQMTQGDTATYTVNVTNACDYKLVVNSFASAEVGGYFKIYLDDVRQTQLSTEKVGYGALSELGYIFLPKGLSEIKLECVGGTPWINSITLEADTTEATVSADAATTIIANKCYDATGIAWDAKDKFMALTQNDTIIYGVNVLDSGNYNLTLNLRAVGSLPGYFKVYVDDVQQTGLFTGKVNSAELSKLGSIYLSEGSHKIKIECIGGTPWLNSITLEKAVASVTLYEGGTDSTTVATGITDGTMSVKADLNGTTEAGKDVLVIFAIYESDGTEFTRLHGSVVIPVAAANLGETVSGSISGISQVSGCTYTAKVFIWDATTITGDMVSFFN